MLSIRLTCVVSDLTNIFQSNITRFTNVGNIFLPFEDVNQQGLPHHKLLVKEQYLH